MQYYNKMCVRVKRDRAARGDEFAKSMMDYLKGQKPAKRGRTEDSDDDFVVFNEFNMNE